MANARLLTPLEAEAVIEERIEQFGPGSLPSVEVTALADGNWRVRWDHRDRVVAPMTDVGWHAWLEENVGSLDACDLETTESWALRHEIAPGTSRRRGGAKRAS